MTKSVKLSIAIVLCFGITLSFYGAGNVTYRDGTKSVASEEMVGSISESIAQGNVDSFLRLFDESIVFAEPGVLASNSDPLSFREFAAFFKSAISYDRPSYCRGVLFDDEFARKEFGGLSYRSASFSVMVNRDHLYRDRADEYNIYIYRNSKDLSTVKLVVRNKKIREIFSVFASAYDENESPPDDAVYFASAYGTKIFDRMNGKELGVLPRNTALSRSGANYSANGFTGYIRPADLAYVTKDFQSYGGALKGVIVAIKNRATEQNLLGKSIYVYNVLDEYVVDGMIYCDVIVFVKGGDGTPKQTIHGIQINYLKPFDARIVSDASTKVDLKTGGSAKVLRSGALVKVLYQTFNSYEGRMYYLVRTVDNDSVWIEIDSATVLM